MLMSLLGRCIGLSTLLCVLLLFFFPLAHGNFQSTHGPVTALRAKRNSVLLVFSIILAALQAFAVLIHAWFLQIFLWRPTSHSDLACSGRAPSFGILRC